MTDLTAACLGGTCGLCPGRSNTHRVCACPCHKGQRIADPTAAPVPPVPDVREAVAAALAAHLFTLYPGEIACDCEWTAKDDVSRAGDNRMIAAHTLHAADAVLAIPAIATALGGQP